MVVLLSGAVGHHAVSLAGMVSKPGQGHVPTQHRKATEQTVQEICLNPSLVESLHVKVKIFSLHGI